MKILVQAAAESNDASGLRGRDLAVLEEEITRLERLIQSFLDFARPPALKKQLFDVQKIVEPTLGLVSGRADRQGVSLRWYPPRRPVLIEADMGHIRQVLLNLLFNALDVLPRGGTVRIVTRKSRPGRRGSEGGAMERLPAAGRWLTLRVADTGPGLPAGLGQQIFEPFVSTKETGIGLGLSICRRIAEAHGGDISAANGPAGGAIFTVRLPLPAGAQPGTEEPVRDRYCRASVSC
jgi:signal transduction histidine kinase